jgi:hypothetical protein
MPKYDQKYFEAIQESQRKKGIVIHEEIPRPNPSGRVTVGNLYGKNKVQILREQKEAEP